MEMRDDLKTSIYNVLRDRIVYLEYQPGQVLNEKELAAEFGNSRTPVREAILKLQEQRLVKIIPRSGTFVAEMDFLELRDIFIVKQSLEGLATELAADRIGQADLEYLADLITQIGPAEQNNDVPKITEIDQKFHARIHDLTFNKPLIEFLESINLRSARGWCYLTGSYDDFHNSTSNLVEVYNALLKKDKLLAKTAMENHVRLFRDRIVRFLT